jgi:phosphate uptake regulator
MIREPEDITRSTYLLWTAHNLERIADRVTNICERTIFMVTGRLEEINVFAIRARAIPGRTRAIASHPRRSIAL